LVAIAALLSAAIWNGYPIVYSDTSSYLSSGFELDTLVDRPITYGLFIRLTSLNGLSMWTVVLAQSALLWWCISVTLRWNGMRSMWRRSLVVVLISALTGLPFVSGQLMSDVFTSTLVLAMMNLLLNNGLARTERFGMMGILLLSFAMHMSHLGMGLLLLILIIALGRWVLHDRAIWKRSLPVLLLMAVGIIPMGTCLAKSKHVFFAAHMAEEGILQRYLEKHCASEPMRICAAMPIPRSADAFMWGPESPLLRYADWSEAGTDLDLIVAGSFRDPELLKMHVRGVACATWKQLGRFDIGDGNGSFGQGTLLFERMTQYVPSEINAFAHAKQMEPGFSEAQLGALRSLHRWAMFACAIVLPFLLIRRIRSTTTDGKLATTIALVLLLANVINALVNAGTVMVADRFGTKVAWMIPFCCTLLIHALVTSSSAATVKR